MTQADFDRDHRGTLRRARDRVQAAYGADPNVTGVGLGYRIRGGELTDEPAVITTVARKRREAHVSRDRLLPRTIDIDGRSYGVDVYEAGPFTIGDPLGVGDPLVRNAANNGWMAPVPIEDRLRPAMQGCSIGNVEGFGIGTMSGVVRDRTDDTICVLSNNHVIANVNQGRPGQVIVNPGSQGADPANEIAKLKRFVPLSFDQANPASVDAGIAQVTNDSLVSKNVALGLMPPISSAHPAVGLLFAGDIMANIFMCDIGNVLNQLNVDLLATNAYKPAELGMNVDKVGRTTRYSASRVVGLDFNIYVGLNLPGLPPYAFYTDVHLVQSFGWAGDSGSMICAGGNNDRPVIVQLSCGFAGAIADMYDLPASATPEFGDRIRDEFLALTPVGRLLTQVLYLNTDTFMGRVEGVEASAPEKDGASQLYAKYRTFMESALNDPDNPQFVVTQAHIDDTYKVLYGFSLRATREETAAANSLYENVLKRTIGMNHQQLLAFMSDRATYQQVYDTLATVPNIVMRDPDPHL